MAKKLPKGLREFQATLSDPKHADELLRRLLDLPENGLYHMVERHNEALRAVGEAQKHLSACLSRARELAQMTFRTAVENWTVEQIQEATGYTDE